MSGKGATGGRFDFDDGGTYCGGWDDGKANGHGVCTGPQGQGEYSGSWNGGFEVSGVYTWPTGSTYEGQWQSGKRHGLGAETRGRWVFRGEWTIGLKGRYGVRQCITSGAKYDGTWANGLPDGYGSETYADGGTFQGQWLKGMRHGYGVRTSAAFGFAATSHTKERHDSHHSLNGDVPGHQYRSNEMKSPTRGGFVLNTSTASTNRQRKIATIDGPTSKRPKRAKTEDGATGAWTLHRSSTESLSSRNTGGSDTFLQSDGDENVDNNVIETYMGEWKNDKRTGFGIAERSDGLKYEGEWYNNKKYGYGTTTFKDGSQECGKYINNILVVSSAKKRFFFLRSSKFRRKVAVAVDTSGRSSEIALQKADIAISRTATARGKAEQADQIAAQSRQDSKIARSTAKQLAPEFQQPGIQQKFHKDTKAFVVEHTRSRSFYPSSGQHSSKELLSAPDPTFRQPEPTSPAQSALLNVFGNNPDRRPSTSGFLRRPSCFGSLRRPSTVVELKLEPHIIEQVSNEPYPQSDKEYAMTAGYSVQDAVDEHYCHYSETPTITKRRTRYNPKKSPLPPNHDLSSLSNYYGPSVDDTPDSGISESMEVEDHSPTRPPRRSTLPNALDPEIIQINFHPDGNFNPGPAPSAEVLSGSATRPGSLYQVSQNSANYGCSLDLKQSLPDITMIAKKTGVSPERTLGSLQLLSAQRKEALRLQEEETEKLRKNPLLYLWSPRLREWLSQYQLIILVLFINISLFLFFVKFLT